MSSFAKVRVFLLVLCVLALMAFVLLTAIARAPQPEAYVHASEVPLSAEGRDDGDDDGDDDEGAAIAATAGAVKLFAPLPYKKGEFTARRQEMIEWLLQVLGTRGRRRKRVERAHKW